MKVTPSQHKTMTPSSTTCALHVCSLNNFEWIDGLIYECGCSVWGRDDPQREEGINSYGYHNWTSDYPVAPIHVWLWAVWSLTDGRMDVSLSWECPVKGVMSAPDEWSSPLSVHGYFLTPTIPCVCTAGTGWKREVRAVKRKVQCIKTFGLGKEGMVLRWIVLVC